MASEDRIDEISQTSTAATKPLGLRAYHAASQAAEPLAQFALQRRMHAGKEDPKRIGERRGEASAPRPDGRLLWIHGASVGESLSVLPLVDRLLALRPNLSFLVTTGTVTSAKLMAERLPERAIHQFIPVDHPAYVESFLAHWSPDAAIFVESEFWPNLLLKSRAQVPFMALVNGRVSPRSFESWRRRQDSIRYLLSTFDFMIAQDRKNASRLTFLSGGDVDSFGNLKNSAPPLPGDETEIDRLRHDVSDRLVWLAASTHPGEEESIIAAHKLLAAEFPGILTLLAPRHPERGEEIADLVKAEGLHAQRRSLAPALNAKTDIYVADTLGELGLFYRLSNVAFVGGSLTKKGGHNPLEPARLGCAILHGPHTFNFDETYEEMRGGGGAALVRNERDLASAVRRLMSDEKTRLAIATAARTSADASAEKVLNNVSKTLLSRIEAILDQQESRGQ